MASITAEVQQFLTIRHICQPDSGPTDAATELFDRPFLPSRRPSTQAEKQSSATTASSERGRLARGLQVS